MLPLSYRFAPGMPERRRHRARAAARAAGQLRAVGLRMARAGAAPGARDDACCARCPKELRRSLAPMPETAAAVLEGLRPRREPLRAGLSRELERVRGVRVAEAAWDLARLEPHLRMRFAIEDERRARGGGGRRPRRAARAGAAAAARRAGGRGGRDRAPRHAHVGGGRDPARGDAAGHGRRGPRLPGAGRRGGDGRAWRLWKPQRAQARAMRLRDAAAAAAHDPGAAAAAGQSRGAGAGGARRPLEGDPTRCRRRSTGSSARFGGPAWDAGGVRAAARTGRRRVDGGARGGARPGRRRASRPRARSSSGWTRCRCRPFEEARRDVQRQLGRLVHPGFITSAGVERLDDVVRYLRAAARRLDRLPDATAADRDRMTHDPRARGALASARVGSGDRLAARGAARGAVRPGTRHARAGVGQASAPALEQREGAFRRPRSCTGGSRRC